MRAPSPIPSLSLASRSCCESIFETVMPRTQPPTDRQKAFDIAIRVLTASFGGYFATYMAMFALARILPLTRADSVLLTSMLGFLVAPALMIWIFAARSTGRMVATLFLGILLCAAAAAWAG
ncbi:MAG: hypothetical protein QM605_15560 [Sphingobium sp.]